MTIHQRIKESENIIYKDEDILVVLDIDPISKGHILIIPQESYLDVDEIPEMVLVRIFKAAKVYIGLLKQKYGPKGYSMMQNGGGFNEIDVFHLHVFPRFSIEEFGFVSQNKFAETEVLNLKEMMQLEIDKAFKTS